MRTKNQCLAFLFAVVGAASTTGPASATVRIMGYIDNFNRPDPGVQWSYEDYWGVGEYSFSEGWGADGKFAGMTMDASASSVWIGLGRSGDFSGLFYAGAPSYNCTAQMNMCGWSVAGRMEIIDNASWTYRSTKSFNLSTCNTSSWNVVKTSSWVPSPSMYIRVVLLGNNQTQLFGMDDLKILCTPS